MNTLKNVPLSAANHRYIVHACNSYPKLVEALRETVGHIHAQNDGAAIAWEEVLDELVALLRSLGEL